MKYCTKCGMLLEDTAETCIRCGNDVTLEANVSMYPPEVMETMDAVKQERKKKAIIVALIIVIFVALVAVVAVSAIFINKNGFTLAGENTRKTSVNEAEESEEAEDAEAEDTDSEDAETVEDSEYAEDEEAADEEYTDDEEYSEDEEYVEDSESEEDASEENDEESEEEAVRVVKDDNGRYYKVVPQVDDNENVIFNAVIPEDFTEPVFAVDYEKYSTRYPVQIQCSAGLEDGTLSFIYMSPSQMWYKNSETGKSRSNERDPQYYMTFLAYDGPKGYVEAILKESYPKAKYELINEDEISTAASENIKELSELKSSELFGDIGDYAHVGEDATYANMDSNYSVGVYEYEITMPDKQIVFDKFYVPMISNDLYYATEKYNDRGTVTEWYILAFVCMEAGNEDLYDDYSKDFEVFVANAVPTDKFMAISQLYADDISECVEEERNVKAISTEMLKGYSRKADSGITLDEFNKAVMKVLTQSGGKNCVGDSISLYAPEQYNVAFYNEDIGKLFISPDEDEYPGEEYTELSVAESQGDMSDDADSEDGDDASADDSEEDDASEDSEEEDSDNSSNKKLDQLRGSKLL